jgi:hypothetical protein
VNTPTPVKIPRKCGYLQEKPQHKVGANINFHKYKSIRENKRKLEHNGVK